MEQWLYKTIITFASMEILKFVFKDFIKKAIIKYRSKNSKSVSFVRGTINTLLLAMIPIIRWVMIVFEIITIWVGVAINEEDL